MTQLANFQMILTLIVGLAAAGLIGWFVWQRISVSIAAASAKTR